MSLASGWKHYLRRFLGHIGTYSYPDTLFEAVAQAVVEFKHDKTAAEPPVLETEVTVSILRKPVEHYIRLKKVRALAQPSNRGGPAKLLRRERVRKMLQTAAL